MAGKRVARRHVKDALAMQRRVVLAALRLKAADVERAAGVNQSKVGNLLSGWVDLSPAEARAVGRLVGKAAAKVFTARSQEGLGG